VITIVLIAMAQLKLNAAEKIEDYSNGFVERANNIIVTFQVQKITYNGIDGFFIPLIGYKQLILILNDYLYLQDLIVIKNNRIKQLEGLELANFKLKTGLGIAISFDVGTTLLAAGLILLCYNLVLGVK
jgi:hypothetical protein